MKRLRILIVTHAPLSAEYGAGQMALNLSCALKTLGHDAIAWSPLPLTNKLSTIQQLREMQHKIKKYVSSQPLFDIIDCPAFLITQEIKKSSVVVARSVQPDLLYVADGLMSQLKFPKLEQLVRFPISLVNTLAMSVFVLYGWYHANFILCLGSIELSWMQRWFPFWDHKMSIYLNTISESDRDALTSLLECRSPISNDKIRFLWIGRWVSHKGTEKLLNFIEKWLAFRPQDEFTIAGCGIEAEANCPKVFIDSGQLKIKPAFERALLHSLLASNDVGLFTSTVEGWGLVLNEMLESGMLIFATKTGGVVDLLPFFTDQLKLFPPTNDVLLEKVKSHKPISSLAIEYRQTFAWDSIAKQYVNRFST